VRLREVATRFWLFTFAGMLLFGVIYYRHAQNELTAQRNQLAARQRAVAVVAGQAGFALRDKLEAWVTQLAEGELSTLLSASASLDEISRGPGIYVRAHRSDARETASLRRAAAHSVRDGFTSCLFIGRSPDPVAPTVACKSKSQCGPGELCDDWGVCAPPGQPYNLRLLYDALRIQGPEWEQRLAATGDALQVRAMELELEDTAKHEVPAAAELIRRSKYFSVVLDEEPGAPAPASGADAGSDETPEERLQASDHFARIAIWDIARSELLLRLRLPVAGRFVALGAHGAGGVAELRARQRQANNCAAAVEVREALLSSRASTASASDALDDHAAPAQPSP
jgi:hypothetical protein